MKKKLAATLPEVLLLVGVGLIVWAAWVTDPQLGKLVAGLSLIFMSRGLARTEVDGPPNG